MALATESNFDATRRNDKKQRTTRTEDLMATEIGQVSMEHLLDHDTDTAITSSTDTNDNKAFVDVVSFLNDSSDDVGAVIAGLLSKEIMRERLMDWMRV